MKISTNNLKSTFKKAIHQGANVFSSSALISISKCDTLDGLEQQLITFCKDSGLHFASIMEIDNESLERNILISFPKKIYTNNKFDSFVSNLALATNMFKNETHLKGHKQQLNSQLSTLYSRRFSSIYALPIVPSNKRVTIALFAHLESSGLKIMGIECLKLFAFYLYSKLKEIKAISHSNRQFISLDQIFKEVKRTINTPEKELNFGVIIDCLSSIFPGGCKCTVLWLYNKSQYEAGNELVMRYLSTVRTVDLRPAYLDVDKSLTGLAIKTKKESYYKNVQDEKLFKGHDFAKKKKLKQLIVYPLLDSKGEPIGALNFYPHDNFKPDKQFFKLLSTYIGTFELALETHAIHEQLSTLNNLLSFNKMADGISSEEGFFEKLVSSLKSGEIIGVEGASIFITTPSSNKLKLMATTGVEQPWQIGDSAYSLGEGLTGSVAECGHSIIENNLAELLKKRQTIKVKEKIENPEQNWIGTPVKDSTTNKVLGVIRCVNKTGGPNWAFPMFTVMDQRILEFLAFITAQFIQNLRIFKKMKAALNEKEQVLIEQDEFITSISHEIIIPVTSILGRIGLLKEFFRDENVDPNQINLWFEDIENECFHIEMVSRSYSQTKPVLIKVNIVKDIVLRVKYELERLSRSKGIDIVYTLPKKRVPYYRVDKYRMIQVMYNLVNNAIKYSYRNTDIEINIEHRFDLSLIITVSNKGIGVPKEDKSSIFEKFIRTPLAKRYNPSGTGAGLYYCKKIIEEDHGGEIWLERPDNPTIFAFKLPPNLIA